MKHTESIAALAAAITTILLASTSTAIARNGAIRPDGSAGSSDATASQLMFTCQSHIRSIVRTENAASTTTSTAFNNLPGASTTITVPEGSTRCVKVVFTAEASCEETGSADFCYVRAVVNGVAMEPIDSFQAFVSESTTASGHAAEWIKRLAAGTHTIVIQRRVGSASTPFRLDDWTFDVQVYM